MSSVAVFWDRDNTLIDDPGYISDPGQVKLLPGAAEAVKRLTAAGFENIIITNQSGVARGYFDEAALERIHDRVVALFAEQGAKIDAIYYCPFLPGPEAKIEKYRKDSELRKPRPGMILQASLDRKIELAGSWMVGDTATDAQAGRAAGCRTILIRRPDAPSTRKSADVDFLVNDLAQAAATVLKYTRHAGSPNQPSAPAPAPNPRSATKPQPQPEPGPLRVSYPLKGGETIAQNEPAISPPLTATANAQQKVEPTPEPVAAPPPVEMPPVVTPSIKRTVEVLAERPAERAPRVDQGVIAVPEPLPTVKPPAPFAPIPRPATAELAKPFPEPRPAEPSANAAEPAPPTPQPAPSHPRGPDALAEPSTKKRPETQMPTDTTALLQEILTFLRMVDRRSRTEEFALGKLLGAIAQIVAIGALTWAIFGLIREEFIVDRLGFAILFQLMALTGFVLSPRK